MIEAALDANVMVAGVLRDDEFHDASVRFLRGITASDTELVAPRIFIVESACAIARRSGSVALARETTRTLLDNRWLILDLGETRESLLSAVDAGVRLGLRGADALYAATAAENGVPLITWDRQLIARAGAITPSDWLARHG